MAEPNALARRLRAIREEAGLSTRQLAARAGVHHGYVARIETGERIPSADYLQNIAELFHLDPTELLAYIGIKPSSSLPEPRDYFLRKLGVSTDEADMLASIIEQQMRKRKEEEGNAETD